MFDEWRGTNNGIMAPIITLTQLPETLACRKHGAIRPARELLQSSEERIAVDRGRSRLNDSCLRVLLHHLSQPNNCFAGHDAVGVEDDHVIIVSSPAAQEFGDVAALTPNVIAPMPIKNSAKALHRGAELCPRNLLFGLPDRITGIAQYEKIKTCKLPCLRK